MLFDSVNLFWQAGRGCLGADLVVPLVQICNSQWFIKTSIILFLNKDDVFREKILGPSLIRDYFSDYNGPPHDYFQGREFFQKKFVRLNRSPSKEVYTQSVFFFFFRSLRLVDVDWWLGAFSFTCAVDINMLRAVMTAVTEYVDALSRSIPLLSLLKLLCPCSIIVRRSLTELAVI